MSSDRGFNDRLKELQESGKRTSGAGLHAESMPHLPMRRQSSWRGNDDEEADDKFLRGIQRSTRSSRSPGDTGQARTSGPTAATSTAAAGARGGFDSKPRVFRLLLLAGQWHGQSWVIAFRPAACRIPARRATTRTGRPRPARGVVRKVQRRLQHRSVAVENHYRAYCRHARHQLGVSVQR
jgi:hypothetical protein